MIVLDASAYVNVVLDRAGPAVYDALAVSGHWVVPEHFRLEAVHAIRAIWLSGALTDDEFSRGVETVAAQDVDIWPTVPLLPRIRELAANVSTYDAAYLALAEELGSPLVTSDRKFGRVPGIRCRVLGVS